MSFNKLENSFNEIDSIEEIKTNYFHPDGLYNIENQSFCVPDFWPKMTNALLQDKRLYLSKAIDSQSEVKDIVLHYAKKISRQNISITNTNHAIAMLGTERLFPVITLGMVELVQRSYAFMGSDELNNKINRLTNLSQITAKQYCRQSMPEYVPLVNRLLALSLFSIPKVTFSSNSHNVTKIHPLFANDHFCLAEIHQYKNLKLWLQVLNSLVATWRLPKPIKQFITKYIHSIANKTVQKWNAIEREWLLSIELATCYYMLLLNTEFTAQANTKFANLAKKHKLSPETLYQQAQKAGTELNIYTSLL